MPGMHSSFLTNRAASVNSLNRITGSRSRSRKYGQIFTSASVNIGEGLVKASVAAATAVLTLLVPGKALTKVADVAARNRPGSVAEVQLRLENEYLKKQYFVTGDVDADLYAADCLFADPTISFRGIATYKRNLQTLKSFFIQPRIELYSLVQERSQHAVLKAQWRLQVTLRLPWRPLIDIQGETIYTLDPSCQIVNHTEKWSISANQALQQIFTWPKQTGAR